MPRRDLNTITTEVWEILKRSPSPLPAEDIATKTAMAISDFGEALAETRVALEVLHREGVVYPAGGDFWATTQYGQGERKSSPYGRFQTMNVNDFVQGAFKPYYEHLKQIHPEYNATFTEIEKSPSNFKGFIQDVWKIFAGKYKKFSESNKSMPEYVPPALMTSIEQAIVEVLQEMNQYHPQLKGKIPEAGVGYISAKATDNLLVNMSETWVQDVFNQFSVGQVLSEEDILKGIGKYVTSGSQGLPKGASKDLVTRYLYAHLARSPYLNTTASFGADIHQAEYITEKLRQLFQYQKRGAFIILNMFQKSAAETSLGAKKAAIILSGVFSGGGVFDEANFGEGNFTGVSLSGCSFKYAKFISANFGSAKVLNNDFTSADFTQAQLTAVGVFESNTIQDAEFLDAGVKKGFPDPSNTGTPKNLSFKDLERSKEGLSQALLSPTSTAHTVVISEQEKPDAEKIVKALWGILQEREILSSLILTSALSPEQVMALQNWLQDPEKIPTFLPKKNPVQWFVEKNQKENGRSELTDVGFSKGDINRLFGRVRNLVEGPKEKKPAPTGPDPAIQAFIDAYKGQSSVPTEEVLKFLSSGNQNGYLAEVLKMQGKALSLSEMYSLVVSLANTLKFRSYPVQPRKWIQAFPYSTYTTDLKHSGSEWEVAGAGTQFGVVIKPDYSMIPEKLHRLSEIAIKDSTHLVGALAFSRIQPFNYTILNVGTPKPVVKMVWYISEMQSDAYQKGADKVKDKEAFRSYFMHWPEQLLNSIIQKAVRVGVDEIWMPHHEDVEKKTFGEKEKQPRWDYAYDRPAKAFGGVLRDVGTNVLLDPGSSYKRTSSRMYVISLEQFKKQGSLVFADLQTFGVGPYDPEELAELVNHHVHWMIEHNRPKFPETEKYVTDNQIAQWAYRTFFDEYLPNATPEMQKEVQEAFEEAGFKVFSPPYIDWLHWVQKALTDIRFFIKNQKRISPDMAASGQELARDWYKLWQQEQMPADMKQALWYPELLHTVVEMLKDKRYGDVTSEGFILPPSQEERAQQILNPTDTGEGEKILEGQDILLPGGEEGPDLSFLQNEPLNKQKLIDKYLDMLTDAKAKGDQEKIRDAQEMLNRLSTASSLKLKEKE